MIGVPKVLKHFNPGDSVSAYTFSQKTWEPAQMISKCQKPRSYVIQIGSGKRYVRNRVYMRPSQIPLEIEREFDVPDNPLSHSSNISTNNLKLIN